MNKKTETTVATVVKKKYIAPSISIFQMSQGAAIMQASQGWTTTDKPGGNGIIEENPDDPRPDDTFGAKENHFIFGNIWEED